MSKRTTAPKGRPTPTQAEVVRPHRFTMDPRLSWSLLVLSVVALLVVLAVLGVGDGGPHTGPIPTGGHG